MKIKNLRINKRMFNRYFLGLIAVVSCCAVFFAERSGQQDEGISLENFSPVNASEVQGSSVLNNQVRVVHVYDGDTVDVVRQDGNKMKIRLYGIDAPEKNQKFANTARVFLEDAVKDKIFTMEIRTKDKYNRYVAVLYDENGIALQEDLLRNGFVWVYPRYCDDVMLCVGWESVEDEAIRTRQGLWQDENPLSPWDYKHSRK